MPTQNVNLTDQQSAFIRQCVESGDFQNASEVVRAGLRLLREEKETYQARLEHLKAELQKGFDAIEAGEYIDLNGRADIDEYFAEINRRGKERFEKEQHVAEDSAEYSG